MMMPPGGGSWYDVLHNLFRNMYKAREDRYADLDELELLESVNQEPLMLRLVMGSSTFFLP